MSKLFKLKKWLTIDETVTHLSAVLGEAVHEKDIFRLVLDGYLQLSVDFVNKATVNKGRFIKESEVEFLELPNIFGIKRNGKKSAVRMYAKDLIFDNGVFVRLEEDVVSIDGVWDLPMIGGECLDVEHRYQSLTGGPEVTLCNLEGSFVEKAGAVCRIVARFEGYDFEQSMLATEKGIEKRIVREDLSTEKAEEMRQRFKDECENERFKGYKKDAYYPADRVPEDSVFVVRTSAILDLLNSLDENVQPAEKNDSEVAQDSNTTESIDKQLLGSNYWGEFRKLACLAISRYPAWRTSQRKIQKSGNLQDWLVKEIHADNREAEFIKKILTDLHKELR